MCEVIAIKDKKSNGIKINFRIWRRTLASVKITLVMCVTILLGLVIDQLGRTRLDRELITIGSFEHPDLLTRTERSQNGIVTKLNLDAFIVKANQNENQYNLLPKLDEIHWPKMVAAQWPAGSHHKNGSKLRLPNPFEPVMSSGQISLSRKLLQIFSDLMFANGYGNRFWLNGGTLVGSYHHHDFIPWDDDIDVLADAKLRPEIQRLLKSLEPQFLTYSMIERDKLFTPPMNDSSINLDLEYSRITSDKPWAWPFLDIGYYSVRPTLTCEHPFIPGKSFCVPNSIIFPLIFRPFGKHWYPAPGNSPAYLRSVYRMRSSCVTFGFSHIFEDSSQFARVPCHTLIDRYPFLRHGSIPNALVSSVNKTLEDMFVVNEERLAFKTTSGWKTVHTLRLPIKREEIRTMNGFGLPEPR